MKLTNESKNKIKKLITKKHSLKEGIVDYIFGKMLVKKLSNDSDFVRMAKRLDSDMQKLRDEVEDLKKQGKPIPHSYKAILNIK